MPESDQSSVSRIVLLAAFAVGLLSLGLYLQTLHPGVGPSLDSMELQIAALVGGVIHPPGSPQYLMLGRLIMTAIPGPSPAYLLNLMSALCASAMIGVTFLLTYRLTQNLVTSSFAALLLAVAPRVWYQASIAELYSLNGLYVALVLYLLVTWHQTRNPAAYWSAVVVYALSFGNHLSMILLLPVFLYIVQITDRSMLLRPRHLAVTAVIVIVAALQYLYIPLRAAANPPFCNYCPIPSQSLATDPAGLIDYLTGGPFRAQILALPRRELLARLPESLGQVAQQFMPWGLALGIIGAWELFQRRAELAWTFVLGLAAEYLFVIAYAIPDWHDFLIPVYIIATPLVGYGALQVWELLQPQYRLLLIQGGVLSGYTYLAALAGSGVLALAINLYAYLPAVDQSDNTTFAESSQALLDKTEPGAWVLMPGRNSPAFYYSWAVRYMALAEGRDITMVSHPDVDPPPGPSPAYLRWSEAAPELVPTAMMENDRQIWVLDWADDRIQGWGLLPVCVPDSDTIAGYEVVAVIDDGAPAPLVEAGRWEAIHEFVVFDGEGIRCPPR